MAAVDPTTPESRIEEEVRHVRALLEKRQLAQALAAAQALLVEVPQNRDVLYLIAVSQRYLGRVADALTTLASFEALHPDSAVYSRNAGIATARSANPQQQSRLISEPLTSTRLCQPAGMRSGNFVGPSAGTRKQRMRRRVPQRWRVCRSHS